MAIGDPYAALGLTRSATPDDIRSAYHSAARRFHPDANPNPGASDEFKLVAEAYAILTDPARRSAYDAGAAQSGSRPLLAARVLVSRNPLPASVGPQVLYALLEIQPALQADAPAAPVNLCIVIDRSTSMQGPRLDQVKAAVLQVIDSLRESDTFSVVAFSDRAEVIIPAHRSTVERTVSKAKVTTISAGGGTEILQGVLCGLTELHRHLSPSAVNHLLLLTDGRTYGDEDDCLMLASLAATDGISMSGLGIGDEWNDRFLDELTGRTGGTAAYSHSPEQVQSFIQERVRGLGGLYAERVNVQVTLDPGISLQTVFRVSPEAGPVPLDQPLRLGSLPKDGDALILLKFQLPPLPVGTHNIARLRFYADVISLGRRADRLAIDLALPAAKDPPPAPPPSPIADALGRLSQYRMQERAWQAAAAGDMGGAAAVLKTLSTRLLAAGQMDLARVALGEASRLETSTQLSEEVQKQLKYGTRALIAAPRGTGRSP